MNLDELDDLAPVADVADDEYGAGKGHHKPHCDAVWFGQRIEHCTVCHQTFSGESTGMAHRVGPHDPPGRRRCLSSDELTALGLWVETNQYGTDVWHGSPNKKGIQKRRPTIDKAAAS
ncbi:MAG: hypothetical protein ACRD0W_24920 [Acidimicrobiales bacterium]